MDNVKLRVSGKKEDVEQFLKIIESTFKLMLKSPVLQNSDDNGIHQFLDLDPYVLKKVTA